MLYRVYDPVFADARGAVFKQLYTVIQGAGAGRSNFYNPVRSPVTAPVIQFGFITDYRNIRLNIIFIIGI